MKMQVLFPSKPKTAIRMMVIDFAMSIGGRTLNNDMICVEFNDPKDENLVKLTSLLEGKKHQFNFEGKPYLGSLNLPNQIFICNSNQERLNECSGVCLVEKSSIDFLYSWGSALKLIGALKNNNFIDSGFVAKHDNIFLKLTDKTYRLNKNLLFEFIENTYEYEKIFCKKYSSENLRKAIDTLPDEFTPQESYTPFLDNPDDYNYDAMDFYKLIAEQLIPIIAKALAKEMYAVIKKLNK